jgi:CRISPR-associated protein Csa2
MVWLSLGLRALVNVEALNMAESVGNFVRHRKAAIVVRSDSRYIVRYVPVVSGESMGHAYQSWIARLASKRNLPLCEYCEREEFVKHAQPQLFGGKAWEVQLRDIAMKGERERSKGYEPGNVESSIVANCVVEDIGGFLVTARIPVKRTSRFVCGYMVPAVDALEAAVVEPQLHVRHAPTAMRVTVEGEEARGQMIYYVEVGSAVYTWSFGIDLSSVGVSTYTNKPVVDDKARRARVELALDALAHMLESNMFGAKQSRFNPVISYESILLTLSKDTPFMVSSPTRSSYIEETVRRAKRMSERYGYKFKLVGYAGFDSVKSEMSNLGVEVADTIADAIARIKEEALSWLGL